MALRRLNVGGRQSVQEQVSLQVICYVVCVRAHDFDGIGKLGRRAAMGNGELAQLVERIPTPLYGFNFSAVNVFGHLGAPEKRHRSDDG